MMTIFSTNYFYLFSVDVLDFAGFNLWTCISRGWAFVAAAFIIIVPMYQEVSNLSVRQWVSESLFHAAIPSISLLVIQSFSYSVF